MSMWDLLALYDSKKKMAEDRNAKSLLRKQQDDLRKFYDEQITFKKMKQQKERENKQQELMNIREHH